VLQFRASQKLDGKTLSAVSDGRKRNKSIRGIVSANEAAATAQTKPELPIFGPELRAPGAYYLDLAPVVEFPLTDNGQPTTFAAIYRKLRDSKILKVPGGFSRFARATFETDGGVKSRSAANRVRATSRDNTP
jgi:hypothetical protein